jgi:electron transfer flavoprotein beta subunit
MRIVVCLKQVMNPEIPPAHFRIDESANRPVCDEADLVTDPFAENALETAIQLRDNIPGATVTAICLGEDQTETVLRRALSFTADEAVRVWDPAWSELDGLAVGHILARSIKALGGADLVLTGCQASDIEEGLVGPVLAQELGMPCLTHVSILEISEGGRLQAMIESQGERTVYHSSLPAVCTIISSEHNMPRLPKIKHIRLAAAMPIRLLQPEKLDLDPARCQPGVKLERLFLPVRNTACEFVEGADGPALAGQLADKLLHLKIF